MHTFHVSVRPVPKVLAAIANSLGGVRVTWEAESLYVESGRHGADEVAETLRFAGVVGATHVLTEDMDEGPGA